MKAKKWLWLILIALILLVAWRVYDKVRTSQNSKGTEGPGANFRAKQTVSVETAPVTKMNLDDLAAFSGNLLPASKVIITARVSGQLSRLYVNIGDKVRKGQIIAELDDRLYQQDYEKARAALEIARATAEQTQNALDISTRDLADKNTLFQKGFISREEYDQANSLFIGSKSRNDIAQATLHSSQASIKTAEIQLSYTRITAEWNGQEQFRVIGEKFVDEGNALNSGAQIVSMLNVNFLIAEIDVIESDYTRLKIGQPARITVASYPGQVFAGKVVRIAPLLQEASRQARVEIGIANPQNLLKPGMYAKIQISYQQKTDVTVVPIAALCYYKGAQGVFQLSRDKRNVQFIEVRTGILNSDYAEIISPLLSGEVVVLGQDQLEENSAVSLPGAEGKKPGRAKGGTGK
jgi:RND family efflux transporter MFP subunit